MNVLVISEDFRNDQYILRPILQRMFAEIGKPWAKVRMCYEPLGGVDQATSWQRIELILKMNKKVDVFLLVVDRDGSEGRWQALAGLEFKAKAVLGAERILLAENAWQEIEVWALAGQDLPSTWSWQAIRAELHPKETYFVPLAEQRGLTDEPGQGRTTLGREAAGDYKRVRSHCQEDVANLENRLGEWLKP